MLNHKNKLTLTLLLLAIFSFVCISVGGDFLHSIIHHHKDEASRDQCFVSQLLVQAFTIQTAVILALSFLIVEHLQKTYQAPAFQTRYNLPYSQAPPVSL